MTNIQITYNPYTVKTSIILNDQEVDYNVSPLAYVQNKRLQEWIEPREGWKGIYKALQECTGEARIRIEFTGTRINLVTMKTFLFMVPIKRK